MAKRIASWEVSDSFWERVEPLIPRQERDKEKTYKRKAGGGRKPIPYRRVFEGIVYVLRTGCQWSEEINSKKNVPGYRPRRWVVELTHSWLNRFRKLLVRYEKRAGSYEALIHLACAIICWRKVTDGYIIYG